MATGDMYAVDIWSTLQGNINVMNFNCLVEVDPAGGQHEVDLADYFETTFIPGLEPFTTDQKTWECITVQKKLQDDELCPVLGLEYERTINLQGDLLTPGPLPGQCSMCVQTVTTDFEPNPSNRGRDFWYGWVEGAQVNGAWSDATWQLLEAHLHATIFNGFTSADAGEYRWVNWSPKLSAQRCALDPATNPLTALDSWSNIQLLRCLKHVRTQRRRQPTNPCDKFALNAL